MAATALPVQLRNWSRPPHQEDLYLKAYYIFVGQRHHSYYLLVPFYPTRPLEKYHEMSNQSE
jgi:hypothetical protein